MSDMMIAILGVAAVVVAAGCVMIATARVRSQRRRQDRLSIAFERAQSVRTRGGGLQGTPHGIYAEPVWSVRSDRGDR